MGWVYVPGPLGWATPDMRREFERIAQATAAPAPRLQLEVQNREPDKPRNGMIAVADGVNWNPGATGAGVYARIGGAWVKL